HPLCPGRAGPAADDRPAARARARRAARPRDPARRAAARRGAARRGASRRRTGGRGTRPPGPGRRPRRRPGERRRGGPARHTPPAADPELIRSDPIAWLAEAAGHGDPERFWEDVVEHRGGEQAFAAITDAMAALREAAEPDGNTPLAGRGHEARREAQMRQAI